jgi:hypothetical protein
MKNMPEALGITPVDSELTRLPLPILMKSADFSSEKSDFHHLMHPEKSEQLGFDPATHLKYPRNDYRFIEGRAVRKCLGQNTPKWLHTRYHYLLGGPDLSAIIPTTKDKFRVVVLSGAGVVPRQAIDLYTPGEFEVCNLSDSQHDFIRRHIYFEEAPNPLKRYRKNRIGHFLAEYTVKNSLPDVVTEKEVKRKVEEFLRTKDESKRQAAGHFILTTAIDAAVADLIPIHREARKEGLVHQQTRSLGDVVLKFFTVERFADYYESIEDQAKLIFA